MSTDRVSVIMPVRNGRPFVAEAVMSALDQGPIVAEVIVADDGSTDGTAAALDAIADPRLRRCATGGEGVSSARNSAMALACGDWVLFLDADDRLVPGAVAALLRDARPEASAVYGDYDRIDVGGRRVGLRHVARRWRRKPSGDILRAITTGNFIGVGCLAVRRAVFERIGGFHADIGLCEDWLMWCRIAAVGPVDYKPGLHVVDYRIHGASTMHRCPRSYEDLVPVVEHIFADPLVLARLGPGEVPALRARAEQSLRSYAMTEAVRMGSWPFVINEVAGAMRRQPRDLPRLTVRLAAYVAGL